jgi:hypothetical protein
MVGTVYLSVSIQIATVVVPVAVYFLVLGLLNSRRHPQLLAGRTDFALLIAALSPLFVLPVLAYVGTSPVAILLAVAVVAGLILLLAPRGHAWVIYNLAQGEAKKTVAAAMRRLDVPVEEAAGGFHLPEERAFVQVGGFPLLRNVSIRLRGGGADLAGRLESALSATLGSMRAEPNPAGVSMLLVATGMLIAPLTLLARDVPEIVRLLTDIF